MTVSKWPLNVLDLYVVEIMFALMVYNFQILLLR